MTARRSVSICEVGTREGFQIEPDGIPAADKAALVNSLSATGLTEIQTVLFVSPKAIPQFADAETVLSMVEPAPGVTYTGVWFNERGLDRALTCPMLTIIGTVSTSGSAAFARSNWNSDSPGLEHLNRPLLDRYQEMGVPVAVGVAAAFGCNFSYRVPVSHVMRVLEPAVADVWRRGLDLAEIHLSDTMAWANPDSIQRMVEAVRDAFPGVPLRLHLHDTRGLGLANAYAGLEAGVDRFDTSIAGLGGCPFAKHTGAAGNVATEDFVLMCHELGYETGVDPERILTSALLAQKIVKHPTNSRSVNGGHLTDRGVIYGSQPA